ncbi:uncharacterized protein ZnT77C [Anabrus simplex]|uniref:uncharacterized protein ZnT77C n=1 Tax=Anabrus simplex TaxID=316456 RepID=UPI0035A2624A
MEEHVTESLLKSGKRMAMKEWFRHMQPVQLYFMLCITGLFFITQMVMSHMTHALTLLVDSYHMLCNLIALTGCIITIKYGSASMECEEEPVSSGAPPVLPNCHTHEAAGCSNHHSHHHHHTHHHTNSSSERRLKNTFGWARIDVLVMLIGCVFLNSLCFSLVVEALQTLIHIDHHDEMHHPIPVLVVGVIGLLINGLCYVLIGGYTFHQASFLHVTADGEVVLDHVVTQDSVRKGQRRLSAQTRRITPPPPSTPRQGPWEMCRDIIGCAFVIVCAIIVNFTDQKVAKLVDPIMSIVSAVTLLVLSYPYMKESGSILLQTIPDTINIDSLRKELLKAFPDILNVHDLHVWRLTASKVFSTVHIIFLNAKDCSRITKEVTDFFHGQGITQVTIQPEFFKADSVNAISALPSVQDNQCLVPCLGVSCLNRHCCGYIVPPLTNVTVASHGHGHKHHSHNNEKICKQNGSSKKPKDSQAKEETKISETHVHTEQTSTSETNLASTEQKNADQETTSTESNMQEKRSEENEDKEICPTVSEGIVAEEQGSSEIKTENKEECIEEEKEDEEKDVSCTNVNSLGVEVECKERGSSSLLSQCSQSASEQETQVSSLTINEN